jgi:hypothetical protein
MDIKVDPTMQDKLYQNVDGLNKELGRVRSVVEGLRTLMVETCRDLRIVEKSISSSNENVEIAALSLRNIIKELDRELYGN